MSPLKIPAAVKPRLRIVASGMSHRVGEEIELTDAPLVIGRAEGCGVVLEDRSVSRRHAQIEATAQGFKLKDLQSGNGTWIDDERVHEATLDPGQRFRIGSTLFECVAEPPTSSLDETVILEREEKRPKLETVPVPTEGFVVKVIESFDKDQLGAEIRVGGSSAVVGRDEGCDIVFKDRDVSRRHAKIETTPAGFQLTDLGSSNGTWLGEQRLTGSRHLAPGERFRVGGATVLECHPAPAERPREPRPAVRAEPASTPPPALAAEPALTPAPAGRPGPAGEPAAAEVPRAVEPEPAAAVEPPATTRRDVAAAAQLLQKEGELVDASAHRPFLLDDAQAVWVVVSGGLDIFTVAVKAGKPAGTRTHFVSLGAGECCFGFDLGRYGMGSGFLAAGKPGTKVRKIALSRFQELVAMSPRQARQLATLVDLWVGRLTERLTAEPKGKRVGEPVLKVGERKIISRKDKVSSAEGVVWVDIWSGSLLYNGMATPVFRGKHVLFPITPHSWVQPVGDEFGDLSLRPFSGEQAITQPNFWQGFYVFHQVLCECEFINKKLAVVDEFIRLQDKAQYSEQAREAAYDAIGSVLRTETVRPREFLVTGSAEPVLKACKVVGRALDIEVSTHLEGDEDLTFEEKVDVIARDSGFRTRVVALRGEWWKGDHGPLLGHREATKTPVAILPTGPCSYECVDPKDGTRTRITAEVAASLAPFAYSFYRPFPDGPLKVSDVMRFGAGGLSRDFRTLLLMGIVIGVLGTLTPFLTGRIFDAAIPQAERGMLLGFGAALFGAAFATSLFKLAQGFATLRVQGKMEYAIQAALWDRLLNLPANFFRKYSAGDLADRAAGIDAIQNLVSGAGVAAVLGSFSGLFYVVLMFTYNIRLAMLAIGLTLSFVGFTTLANYLQLRYQRREIQMRGRITGLVLNLITGVTKLRLAGAEHHAFRVWAQQFAGQRKLSFTVGRIQNAVTVFNGVFPIVSSMAIFIVMVQAQKEAAGTGQVVLTTGEFIAFNAAYGLFLSSMQALGDASMKLLRVVPIYERLKPIITTPAEVDASKVFPGKLKGGLELSHVHFRYHEDGPWIIKDFSLKIRPGEFVAFVGPSGCGKSTLMRLMLGFEQPVMGAIYYDGQDLNSLDLRMLRQQLGVVLQVSKVLPAEIYRNIVGASSRTIDEAWEAAEMAGLADDIRQMPMGMHTYVSEGGGTLSGGQRQRLLIGRAVVNKPKIIFLDEATSALDNRAQATVTESMDRLSATRIVIAHRLSTVVNADKICYLEGGKITEMGRYDELMEKDGLFAQLARRQMA